MIQYILSSVPSTISCFWFPIKIILLQYIIRLFFAYVENGLMGITQLLISTGIIWTFFGWAIIGSTYIFSTLFCKYLLYRQIIFGLAAIAIFFEIYYNITNLLYKQNIQKKEM